MFENQMRMGKNKNHDTLPNSLQPKNKTSKADLVFIIPCENRNYPILKIKKEPPNIGFFPLIGTPMLHQFILGTLW